MHKTFGTGDNHIGKKVALIRDYAQEEHTFEYASKSFSLVDVNNDGVSELIFKIYESPDELMYILGIQGD